MTIEEMETALAEHYGEPVRPVSVVCRGIQTWMECVADNYSDPLSKEDEWQSGQERATAVAWNLYGWNVLLHAGKSNLLGRILYEGLEPRPKKCPVHNGHWSGLVWPSDDQCDCVVSGQLTGWIED